ncbi:MAG: Transcriptional regulator, AcrR family [uncultured Thermomicrobiales bacterium]|uniref:Transcriptional regulator, AcrR family n=1 Tax=uncultured Thermomicrobiales bacterium TaxID=1645740 RepID=A0A6J4VMI5_9BACT|nr:MAG: Transcriptional regulator, AcrR family [uncultured Thermomicrobiales bacterium]
MGTATRQPTMPHDRVPAEEPPLPCVFPLGAAHHERRDAAENRRRILDTAQDLFAREGVDAVSMNEIARAAGIGPGTLYRRYAHKGALCAALLEENMERFRGEIAADPPGGTADRPALSRLEFVLARLIAFNEENGQLLGAVSDAACGERRHVVYSNPFYNWLHGIVAGLLARTIEAGEAPPLDVAWFADALLAPLAIDLYLFQRRERGFAPEQILAGVRQLLAGLRAGAAAMPTTGTRGG